MTPEELNENLARRAPTSAESAGVRDGSHVRPPMPARDQALIGAVGHELNERDKRIAVLEQRLDALEKKIEQRRYVGVWAVGKYHEGNLVTHDGSMWHCNRETEQRPGTGPDWTLAIKRGQNGKDADARRFPTQARTYGNG